MVCFQCGCEQVAPAQFCRQCGVGLAGPAFAYGLPRRVTDNLQPLAIAWFMLGAIRLVGGVIAVFSMHWFARSGFFGVGYPEFMPSMLHAVMPFVLFFSAVMGGASLLVGWGLRERRPWARGFAIFMGLLALFKFPFGTAIGIYTLWVLVPGASAAEWRTIEQA
jgi:hypothetical protein